MEIHIFFIPNLTVRVSFRAFPRDPEPNCLKNLRNVEATRNNKKISQRTLDDQLQPRIPFSLAFLLKLNQSIHIQTQLMYEKLQKYDLDSKFIKAECI